MWSVKTTDTAHEVVRFVAEGKPAAAGLHPGPGPCTAGLPASAPTCPWNRQARPEKVPLRLAGLLRSAQSKSISASRFMLHRTMNCAQTLQTTLLETPR